ncbi:hypothetical protein ASG99_09145 [Bacillus sp. Soil768D1]|nr:hypothetical protein ASG99_09145 [Bacillus sp. Soil768D1]
MPGVEINVRIFKTLKKTVDKLDFKRVPGVEINVRIFKTLKKTVDKLDFHRVCLQSESLQF